MNISQDERRDDKDLGAYSPETRLIYGEMQDPAWDYSHHLLPPISSSATYRLDSAQRGAQGFMEFAHHTPEVSVRTKAPIYIYDRLGEPNKDMLEQNLAFAEGGDVAITFASGMAAVSGVLGMLTATGSEIVAHSTLYGCTYSLLTNWYPRLKIGVRFTDLTIPGNLEKAISEKTRVVYVESPVNPTLRLVDLKAVADIVRTANAKRAKDRAHLHGGGQHVRHAVLPAADLIRVRCRGAQPHQDHRRVRHGGRRRGHRTRMEPRRRCCCTGRTSAARSPPRAAWSILVIGLPSLPTRMRQMQETAGTVAQFLMNRSEIECVHYPGLPTFPQHALARRQMVDYDGNFAPGAMIYFVMKGKDPNDSLRNAEACIDRIARDAYCVTLAVSLGNIRTLIEHPGSMTHSAIPAEEQVANGMDPGGIRLAIGLEKADDIIRDLKQSLEAGR